MPNITSTPAASSDLTKLVAPFIDVPFGVLTFVLLPYLLLR